MTRPSPSHALQTSPPSWQGLAGTERDQLLDIAKGVAILLVVIGHTIQARSSDFDNHPAFRFIYSFHMPLFALLAGASAAFWIKKYNDTPSVRGLLVTSASRLRRSAEHLLLPFITWTVLGHFLSGQPTPFTEYLWKVIVRPDHSLWFLPCIFWCTTYAVLSMLGMSALRLRLQNTRIASLSQVLQSPLVQVLLMFLVWKLVSKAMPLQLGLVFANQFHGGLFGFFLLGIAVYAGFTSARSWWVRALPYLVFASLVAFWHRTAPYNLAEQAPAFLSGTGLRQHYALVVAISGSLVFVDIARALASLRLDMLTRPMLMMGSASLGIYAVHFHFLDVMPPVIAPIVISLLVWHASSLVPPLARVLFGK